MNLICISDKWTRLPKCKHYPCPFVGEECEAISSHNIGGELYYQLAGRFHTNSVFHYSMFALVSDIDEKNFERKYLSRLDHNYE